MTCVLDCGYGDDGGSCDVLARTVRKARKPHRCCECRRKIAHGDRYEEMRLAGDGSVWRYKTCPECAEIRSALPHPFALSRMWGDLGECLDVLGEGWALVPWSAVTTLSKPARDKFCDWLESLKYADEEEVDYGNDNVLV